LNKKEKQSELDIKDWKTFLENPSNIFDKDKEIIQKKKYKKFKFDLHGCTIEQANKKVNLIINKCYEEKFSEILLITGKGKHSKKEDSVYFSEEFSKLKNTIPNFIKNNSDLMSKITKIESASKDLGGGGAIVIKLKKLQDKF